MADQTTVTAGGIAAKAALAASRAFDDGGHAPTLAVAGKASTANGIGANAGDVVASVAEFGENLLSLGELQARLAAIELKQNLDATLVGGAVLLTGFVLAVASVPIALAGAAELLVSELAMKRGHALLCVSVVALIIAGALMAIAGQRLRRKFVGFPLSGEELTRNLNWIRTVLTHSGRSPRRR